MLSHPARTLRSLLLYLCWGWSLSSALLAAVGAGGPLAAEVWLPGAVWGLVALMMVQVLPFGRADRNPPDDRPRRG